jgi:DNA-binding LytR/AlgR family response regulator
MNCIIVDDDKFARTVIKKLVLRTNLDLLGEFSSAIAARNVLRQMSVDLIFLDVEMPEMSGLDLIKSLSKMPQVVLVSSNRQYGVEAFEYSVTDYLIKPVEYPRFLRAVDKAEMNLRRDRIEAVEPNNVIAQPENNSPQDADHFFVKTKDDGLTVKIIKSEIIYVEALSDYVEINTEKSKFVVHTTMRSLEQKLAGQDFARVHRSYIINIKHIESIDADKNVIMPGKVVPIGGSYKTAFLNRMRPFNL